MLLFFCSFYVNFVISLCHVLMLRNALRCVHAVGSNVLLPVRANRSKVPNLVLKFKPRFKVPNSKEH